MGNVSKLGKIPPAATPSSPGAVASSLTTALTPTGDSLYVSAVEKAKVDTLAAGGFVDAFANAAGTYAPGATIVGSVETASLLVCMKGGANAGNTNDILVPFSVANAFPGGGLGLDADMWYRYTNTVISNPSSGPWGVGVRLRLGAPASGKSASFVIGDFRYPTSQNGRIEFGHDYSLGGSATTKYFVKCVNMSNATGGPQYMTGAIDDGFHDVWLMSDGTILKVFLDGVQIGTSTDVAHMPNTGAACMALQHGLNAGYGVCRIAWAQ